MFPSSWDSYRLVANESAPSSIRRCEVLALGYRAVHDLSRVDHIARLLTAFLPFYSIVNRKNNVTELQRFYQTAYAQHNRIWKIVSQFPPSASDLVDALDPRISLHGTSIGPWRD